MLLDRLEAWGVKRLYGYPGDGINGLFGALREAGERFEFVQARHEEMAAFMACGSALRGSRPQQPRPEPGHVGAAGDGRRPEVRGLAGSARLPVRALCRADRVQ